MLGFVSVASSAIAVVVSTRREEIRVVGMRSGIDAMSHNIGRGMSSGDYAELSHSTLLFCMCFMRSSLPNLFVERVGHL